MNNFTSRLEQLFAQGANSGKQWKKAAARALGISHSELSQYIKDNEKNNGANIPRRVLDTLESLEHERAVLPSTQTLMTAYAKGLVEVQKQIDRDGWLSAPYPGKLTRALDIAAAYNAEKGEQIFPADLSSLVKVARKPLYQWCKDLSWDPEADFTTAQLLSDGTITTECASLAAGSDEDSEERPGYELLLQKCSNISDGQALYVAWRRFVIEYPVIEGAMAIAQNQVLANHLTDALDLLDNFYEPIHSALSIQGKVFLCPLSKTRLNYGSEGWQSEYRDPAVKELLRKNELQSITYTREIRQLKRVFRQFWCLPGLAEVKLYQAFKNAGWTVELWPEIDKVDLIVVSPEKEKQYAVDIKDYFISINLAKSFEQFKAYQKSHQCLIVVPDYLTIIDPDYQKKFSNARSSFGKSFVELKTLSEFTNQVGVKLP